MKLVKTKDGSHTLVSNEFGEHYHSINGSIQEAEHIFINNGLKAISKNKIHVFEMGFGSGLNTILSYYYAKKQKSKIVYHTIEAYPISIEIANQLNYNDFIQEKDFKEIFNKIHTAAWNETQSISPFFKLHKIKSKIEECNLKQTLNNQVDIVFFDAFAPNAQAHLWEEDILQKMYEVLKVDSFLITYCAKGVFKRTLKKLSYEIEPLPGPIGKREITKAVKLA